MQKWRVYVKGSIAENVWLNNLAARGWLLTAIKGRHYSFKKVTGFHHVFSEYIKVGPVDLTQATGAFQAITQFHMKNPDLWVVYTSTTNQKIANALHQANDEHLELAIARVTRTRLLNSLNAWVMIWFAIGILAGIIGVSQDADNPLAYIGYSFMIFCVMMMALGMLAVYWPTSFVHRNVLQLTRATGDYNGTWLPTWHITIEKTAQVLDTKQLAYLGRWLPIAQNEKKQTYYYNLQTNEGERAIRDAISHALNDPQAKVSVISWLGLGPMFLPW